MAPRDIKKTPKWEKQETALKKVQITFELMQSIDKQIRMEAAKTGDSPSNIVRRVLGLEVKPPIRPRLGVSLSKKELEDLAVQYQIDPDDRKSLIRRATEAIQQYYQEQSKQEQ